MIPYTPLHLTTPPKLVPVPTAWDGMETGLQDIIRRFAISPTHALEFGVQHGFSISALANYFRFVDGVDTFAGDVMAGIGDPDHTFKETMRALEGFPNIDLHRIDVKDWMIFDDSRYDLIHVDILHTYEDTYNCGAWAVEHSDVVIFHDTLSFPDVSRVCEDIASNYELNFYNWEFRHGLGILSKRRAL